MVTKKILNYDVEYDEKNERFLVNSILPSINKNRLEQGRALFNLTAWMKSKQIQETIKDIEDNTFEPAFEKSMGRNSETYFSPMLFLYLMISEFTLKTPDINSILNIKIPA